MEFKCFADKAEVCGITALNREVNHYITGMTARGYKVQDHKMAVSSSGDNVMIAPVIVIEVWMEKE